MNDDTIDSLYNYTYAILQMDQVPDSEEKYRHMLGMCDLMQNTLDILKENLKSKIENSKKFYVKEG